MIKRILLNRRFFGLLGFVCLIAVIVIAGPMLAFGQYRPLASYPAQAITIALIGLLIVSPWLLRKLQAGVGAKKLVNSLRAMARRDAGQPEHQNVAVMAQQFDEAITLLKQRSPKGNLYELPWYVIVGPPGCGKTTALMTSGLHFPLEDRYGADGIRGVGGTRNCDWWFTDEAVMIDTAGRYLTQDSDPQSDQAEWREFINLVRKHRKRRPMNGIIVAISLSDVLSQSREVRLGHSVAIKRRLAELKDQLGLQLPVYVVLTKCDLVAGFTEFFEDLRDQERDQVWGMTFALPTEEPRPLSSFESGFDELISRLNGRVIARMQDESDVLRRQRIFAFPRQLALQRDMLSSFFRDLFAEPGDESNLQLLRGIYLTSGTQDGVPLDRVGDSLSRRFQLPATSVNNLVSEPRSFFLHDLLTRVIFKEAGLVGSNRANERRLKNLSNLAYGAIAAIALSTLVLWSISFSNNRSYIAEVQAAGLALGQTLEADTSDNAPLEARLDLLEQARRMPGGYADQLRDALPLTLDAGLYQGDKLGAQAKALYRRLLQNLLLPPLLQRLEQVLHDSSAPPEYRYQALATYLRLGSDDHFSATDVLAFTEYDWLPEVMESSEQRAELFKHFEALLNGYDASQLPLPLDQALVGAVQNELSQLAVDEWLYETTKKILLSRSRDEQPFSITAVAGNYDAAKVFVRQSGASLNEGIPALFTRTGHQRFQQDAPQLLLEQLQEREWILGPDNIQASDTGSSQVAVAKRIEQRFLTEYQHRYHDLLGDLALIAPGAPQEAAHVLAILSDPESSPLVKILQAVREQTRLSTGDSVLGQAERGIDAAREELGAILGRTTSTGRIPRADPVSESHSALNALLGEKPGGPRGIDRVLEQLAQLQTFVQKVALQSSINGSLAPEVAQQGQAVAQQVAIEAENLPDLLVNRVLNDAAQQTASFASGGIHAHINELWRGEPLQFCRRAIRGRYPASRTNRDQVIRIDDLGRYFGYGGVLEAFFNQHLKPYVDTSTRPWRNRNTGPGTLRLSERGLAAFERADRIKKTFFGHGQSSPKVRFGLTPLNMDKRLASFVLNLQGQRLRYEFGPQRLSNLEWPGADPGAEVLLQMHPRDGNTLIQREQGPWAWFKVLEKAQITASRDNPEQFDVTFDISGYKAEYQLTAGSAFNPFALRALNRFLCPETI